MATDRTIRSPGATVLSSWNPPSLCSLAPPRYTNSTLPASQADVPLFLTFQPTLNFCKGAKLARLLGDCQISLQSSSLGMVGVGAREGTRLVGVSDVSDPEAVGPGLCSASGVADGLGERVRLGALEGDGVAVRLAAGDRVRLACFEADGTAALSGAAGRRGSAEQAARDRARPTKKHAFLIVFFAM